MQPKFLLEYRTQCPLGNQQKSGDAAEKTTDSACSGSSEGFSDWPVAANGGEEAKFAFCVRKVHRFPGWTAEKAAQEFTVDGTDRRWSRKEVWRLAQNFPLAGDP